MKSVFASFGFGARKNSVDAFEMKGLAGGALGSGIKFVDHNLQLAAGLLGDFVESRNNVIAAAADAAFRIDPGRKRQPSPAGNQLVD